MYTYSVGEQTACTVTVRTAASYRRATLNLRQQEAKLIDVITTPGHRGKEIAPYLIRLVTEDMKTIGIQRLYARIWHSNHASQRAFAKAGWHPMGLVLFISPAGSINLRQATRMLRVALTPLGNSNPLCRSIPFLNVSIHRLSEKY